MEQVEAKQIVYYDNHGIKEKVSDKVLLYCIWILVTVL